MNGFKNFFLPTAEITAQLTGKIGTNLPVAEGLKRFINPKKRELEKA